MVEPWGETKVINIILDALNEGLIDLQDIKKLIKISYHYGVIDGLAITDSEEKHNIVSNIDRMIKIKECTIHEEGMLTQQLINRAKIQGIIDGLKIARKIVLKDKNKEGGSKLMDITSQFTRITNS